MPMLRVLIQDADSSPEIQAAEHLIKHRCISAGPSDGQCLQQPVVLEIGFIVVDR